MIDDSIQIEFPDGSQKDFQKGITVYEVALSISKGLAKNIVAGKMNDTMVDTYHPLQENGKLILITKDSEEGLDILRHSASHIMAQAVVSLFPDAKYTIGPSIEDGFYYDFDVSTPFTPEDLPKIEEKMHQIIKANHPIRREVWDKAKLRDFFKKQSNMYKVELIDDIEDDEISVYTQDGFTDLCRGPHLPSTGYVAAFKLTSVAGSYWRGDSSGKSLSRIYGTAFFSKKELNEYLKKVEEAKKRDHRKLGKELDLFTFHEEGPGFPFWHPKGLTLFQLLVNYMRKENTRREYEEIATPMILNDELWHKSGHYDNFKENMYFTQIDDRQFAVKPMNCPGQLLIYKSRLHSYRELPIKLSEFGLVHRHELSGVLHGLFRVRAFTQDDAHVFCSKEQLEDQIIEMIDYVREVYQDFDFKEIFIYVATRPEKSIGTQEVWDMGTQALCDSLKRINLDYKIKEGEGAFYGPKIEFNIRDSIGRHWQCGTIQIDFSMPERFDLTYEGDDGKRHRPVMIHRAILGSIERFIGILIEHFAGKFPVWIAPIQIIILPVSDKHIEASKKLYHDLKSKGFRIKLDLRDEKLGYKIRAAQLEKIPYMLIIGDKEVETENVSVRHREKGDIGSMDLTAFLEKIQLEIEKKSIFY